MEYAVALTTATREPGEENWVEFGASPRGSINLIHAGRALALLRGRDYMLPVDVRDLARDVLRHRIVLTYEALAAGVDADRVLDDVLERVPMPRIELATGTPADVSFQSRSCCSRWRSSRWRRGLRRSRSGGAGASRSATRTSTCWPRSPGARRRATSRPLLALLALAALLVALARPERTVAAERREATSCSSSTRRGSMLATDVPPPA